MINKYYQILDKILEQGKPQTNKKGTSATYSTSSYP